MSVLLLGVWPGRVLERQIRGTSPDHPLPLTAAEKRGRVIYGQNGCAYCHTQQIRYLDRDVRRFGAATLAWETIFDYPQLWGTRRIGPDLSREGAVRSRRLGTLASLCSAYSCADSVMPAVSLVVRRRAGPPEAGSSRSAGLHRNFGTKSGTRRRLKGKRVPAQPANVRTTRDDLRLMIAIQEQRWL